MTCQLNFITQQLKVCKENIVRYNATFAERKELYTNVKDLEDKFLKCGQTDQTIFLNKPKEFRFYNPKEGLGFDNPHHLQKITTKLPSLYDQRYMGYGFRMNFLKFTNE